MLGYLADKALICGQYVLRVSAFLYALEAWLRVPTVNICVKYSNYQNCLRKIIYGSL